jgi:hypothetical protein
MKLGIMPPFLLGLVVASCGDPATITVASRVPRGANSEKIKKADPQIPASHQSPCGSFTDTPKLEAQVDLVAPAAEQRIATGADGIALLPITLFSRSKITCLEFLAEREGSEAATPWLKLPIEDVPEFTVAKTALGLTEVGWNTIELRAWTNGEAGPVVQLPRVEVVARPQGDDATPSPTPAQTPTPTTQPTPSPTPAQSPTPSPTPNPEATWKYSFYQGTFSSYPDFATMSPVSTGSTWNLKMTEKGARTDNFAFVYEGESWANANPSTSGTQPFTFFLKCDEGCKLFINNFLVVDNHLSRGQEKSGTMNLSHKSIISIRIEYFDSSGPENLEVNWSGPLFAKTPLTSDFLP